MKASNFSDAQKAFILKQGDDGVPVAVILDAAKLLEESPEVTSATRAVAETSADRLPLFASLYPSGTDPVQAIEDYLEQIRLIPGHNLRPRNSACIRRH